MNPTVKYILLGSVAAFGVFLLVKKLQPAPVATTPGTAVGKVVDGVRELFAAVDEFKPTPGESPPQIDGATARARTESPTGAPMAASPFAVVNRPITAR